MSETLNLSEHDLFNPEKRSQEETEKARRYYYEILRSCEGREQINSDLGAELGKAFVRVYETMPWQDNPERLREFQHVNEVLLGEENAKIRTSGFLTETTTAFIFNELGFPVYYPSEEEDTECGIDWWVDLEDTGRQPLALQVKALRLKEGVKNKVIYTFHSTEDVQKILDEVVLPETLDVPQNLAEEIAAKNRKKILDSTDKQLRYKNETKRAFIPTLIILGSTNSEGAQYNALSGEPSRELIDLVFNGLETIN